MSWDGHFALNGGSLISRNAIASVLVLGAATVALGSLPPCYFLKRDSCGTGGGFCHTNQTVCDAGYVSEDFGCGVTAPSWTIVTRHCYKITGQTLTVPCNVQAPAGYVPAGCKDGGVCWYTTGMSQNSNDPRDAMQAPSGGVPCGCGTETGDD